MFIINSMLPDEIQFIIYKYLHQLKLRDSLSIIYHTGISEFEDLPDLISCDSPYTPDNYHSSSNLCIGYSERVSEFMTRASQRYCLTSLPRTLVQV